MAERMRSFAEVAALRDPTDEERAIVEHVQMIAQDYAAGLMTIDQVRRECTAEDRATCARFSCRWVADHPELWAMLDDLVLTSVGPDDGEMVYRTRWGLVSTRELWGVPVRYDRTADGIRLVFTA